MSESIISDYLNNLADRIQIEHLTKSLLEIAESLKKKKPFEDHEPLIDRLRHVLNEYLGKDTGVVHISVPLSKFLRELAERAKKEESQGGSL